MISVIIPVYNCEKYISRCADSVLKQSYQDFELILVDDGSTDASGTLCEEFKLRDTRVHVIHKTNGGASSARNAGLQIAVGEYVAFIDADDWVEANYLESLIAPIKSDPAIDIVVMPWEKEEIFESPMNLSKFKQEACYLEKELACVQLLQPKAWGGWTVWSKLYRNALFQGEDFRIDLPVGEDLIINLELFNKADRFYYVPIIAYCYCYISDSSLTHKIDIDSWANFLRVVSRIIVTKDVTIYLTGNMYTAFCRLVADFYMGWINRLILSGFGDEKIFSKLACAVNGISKELFEQLPKTPLFALKCQLYANPLKLYDNYLKMIRIMHYCGNCGEALYIYGAGKRAKRVSDFLLRENIMFNSFIVTDGQRIDDSPDANHPVIHFSNLISLHRSADITIVLALKDEYAEVVLRELCKHQFKHIFCL